MEPEKVSQQPKSITHVPKTRKMIVVVATVLLVLILIAIGVINRIGKNGIGQAAIPEKNVFYFATYQNTPVLFYKYDGMMMMPGSPFGPQTGNVVAYEHANPGHLLHETSIDFPKLQNPQKLFSFIRFATIENVAESADKTHIAISFVGGEMDATNYIYQVNLKTGESKKIWEHELRTGESPYNGGIAYITQLLPDIYIVFAIIKGDPPPTALPVGVIIRNIQLGNEKVLGVVGDVQINLQAKSVSSRVLKKTLVACVGTNDPECFTGDTHKNSYAPVGQVVTQPLP